MLRSNEFVIIDGMYFALLLSQPANYRNTKISIPSLRSFHIPTQNSHMKVMQPENVTHT